MSRPSPAQSVASTAELLSLRRQLDALEKRVAEQVRTIRGLTARPDPFRAVADSSYDLESWIGTDGRLVWVNRAVERLTGYTAEECLAMEDYPFPLVQEEDRERIRQAFQASSSGNDVSFRLRRKNGETIWVAVSWQPIDAGNGRCLGLHTSIRDISDRKRAEDELLQQQQLVTNIIKLIPSGVFWKGRDFAYLGCNEAFARSAGVTRPEEIVGKTDYELAWDPDQADYFRACDRQVMENDQPMLNLQEVERQADGRQAILLTSKVPLHDADGKVCGVLGIDTDISHLKEVEAELRQIQAELERRVEERTAALAGANRQLQNEIAERERAEAALRVSQERYRLISELTSDYAYALRFHDADGWKIEWTTDAFTRITGGRALSFGVNGIWHDLIHPDDTAQLERAWQGLLSGRSTTTEFRIVGQDGKVRWLCDHARPVRDEATGRLVRILGAAQDITDRKQAEEETRRHRDLLAHMDRLSTMGELTAQLAHELNQPLCTVVGNAQTAQRLLAAPVLDIAELQAALQDIVNAGKHAGQIIRRLREFVRRRPFQPVLLNLQRLIEEVAGFLEADARQHGASIQFDIADPLPNVRGDPIQIQQVILNLVRNGLEAMSSIRPSAREVALRAGPAGAGEVRISVADRGTGLTAQTASHVFEPFWTTKTDGLGLGLAISRSIVEAHGGRLWAEAGPEGGTVFHMVLPVAEESPP